MRRVNYIDIDWPALFKPIPGLKQSEFNRIRINREVIPIIFVPGIMGSRLKNKRTGESVWDPDREIMCMLRKYGGAWNTPAQRKRMLIGDAFDPNYLAVDEHNPLHNRKVDTFWNTKHSEKGWGGIYWGSYGKFLRKLESHEWDKPIGTEPSDRTKEVVGKCFEFPVHAFGYNWTASNLDSGERLANKITAIKAHYKSKGRLCKYVILVSHSMGGLVCRSACMIHHADKDVLGVIHGVQPATGAPAAYWRMKAGFERVGTGVLKRLSSKASAWVLGTNGEEVTCILGNAPGGLELLPNRFYTDNNGESGWLRIVTKGGKELILPRNGDPYKEIYKLKSNHFWRLINPEWLDPQDKHNPPTNPFKDGQEPWRNFDLCIGKAQTFHNRLQTFSHQNTYQFYSSSLNTVDKICFNREDVSFSQFEMPSDFGFPTVLKTGQPKKKASTRGKRVMYVDDSDQEVKLPLSHLCKNHILTMFAPGSYDGGGDGTVAESSGNALKQILNTYMLEGVEHQEAFTDTNAMTYVFKAIRNLALKRIKEQEASFAK